MIEFKTLGSWLENRKIEFQAEFVQASTGTKIYNVVQIDGSNFYVRCENPQNTSGSMSGARDNTTPNISPRTGIFFEGLIEDWQITQNDKDKNYIIKFNALTREGRPWGEIKMKTYTNNSADIEIKSHAGNMIYSNYTGYLQAF